MRKGSHQTAESKLLMSRALKKKWQDAKYSEHQSIVHKANPSTYWLGKKRNVETLKKMSENRKGIPAWNKGKKSPLDERHPFWKGDEVSYRNLHRWVERKLGKANRCIQCGLDKIPMGRVRYFQWANISKQYKRDISDWKQLCIKCHKAFDSHGNREVK